MSAMSENSHESINRRDEIPGAQEKERESSDNHHAAHIHEDILRSKEPEAAPPQIHRDIQPLKDRQRDIRHDEVIKLPKRCRFKSGLHHILVLNKSMEGNILLESEKLRLDIDLIKWDNTILILSLLSVIHGGEAK